MKLFGKMLMIVPSRSLPRVSEKCPQGPTIRTQNLFNPQYCAHFDQPSPPVRVIGSGFNPEGVTGL
jgi:hypothetical protein